MTDIGGSWEQAAQDSGRAAEEFVSGCVGGSEVRMQ